MTPTVGHGLLNDEAAYLYGVFADLSEATLDPWLCADLANFAAGWAAAGKDRAYADGAAHVVAGVRSWCAINEVAEPPLDWEGLGEFLTRVIPPGKGSTAGGGE